MDNLHLFKNNFINKYQCFGWHGKLFIHVKMLYAVSVGKNTLKKLALKLHLRLRVPCILGVGGCAPPAGLSRSIQLLHLDQACEEYFKETAE